MPSAVQGDPSRADLTNWRTPPFNHWAFHHVREVLPVADVPRGSGPPMPLPVALRSLDDLRIPWVTSEPLTLDQVLAATATDGIVILKDGQLIYEAYSNGLDTQTPHILMSATKAVVGLTAGLLQRAGKLDIEAPVTVYVPEVAGTAYDGATIRHLLDMRTGVLLDEEGRAAYDTAGGWDPPPPGQVSDLHGFFSHMKAPRRAHGGVFSYISANTDLLGWAMERAGGASFASLVSEHLWKPLGAEQDAFISTDSMGAARCTGGFNATVRDFARLGQLVLDGGVRDGEQVLPAAWLDDIADGGDHEAWARGEWGQAFAFAGSSLRYRSGWYIVDDAPKTLFAMGIHGQNLFVDHTNRLVMAKLSSQASRIDYAAVPITHRLFSALQSYLAV